ncbi:MAG: hypothetical protein WC004_00670 [Candidatus Absconditabacterales bacterium]
MNLEKLFGSKTKSDILKYLVFRRQGVSIRALESELGWTFPGIKKQIDSLEEAEVLVIDKTPEKRSIRIADGIYEEIRKLIIGSLKHDTKKTLAQFEFITKYYLGKVFDRNIEVDLVILHHQSAEEPLEQLKAAITNLLKLYMIDPAYLVFMPAEEFEKRTKMADKFALSVVRNA